MLRIEQIPADESHAIQNSESPTQMTDSSIVLPNNAHLGVQPSGSPAS